MRTVFATQFIRYMDSGRTSPAMFRCENSDGASAGEYVVKLKGGIETRESGLLREFLGAQLASHFRIATPEPAIVQLDRSLAELVAALDRERAGIITASTGFNFGSKLVVGFATWPVGRLVPESMLQAATDIFAFDSLVQNPDRRSENPNLFTSSDMLLIFDHENAFSFLFDILRSDTPWRLNDQKYLSNHIFFRPLKRKIIDLADFSMRLRALSDTLIENLYADVPREWQNDAIAEKVNVHLSLMRSHCPEFCEEIRSLLV